MIERAITDMTAQIERQRGTSALIEFSERLATVETVNGAFSALAGFVDEDRLGALVLTLTPGQTRGGAQYWATLSDSRLGAFRTSTVTGLIDDLMPSVGRPSTIVWSAASRPGFHRVGDAEARARLFDGGIAGGIAMAMTLPSGRAGRSYAIADDQIIDRLPEHASDLFLIASIHALLAVDRCIGPLTSASLTRREVQILELFERGLRAREIASAMNIAEATVKFHLLGARRKLNARTTREAAALLRQSSPAGVRSG